MNAQPTASCWCPKNVFTCAKIGAPTEARTMGVQACGAGHRDNNKTAEMRDVARGRTSVPVRRSQSCIPTRVTTTHRASHNSMDTKTQLDKAASHVKHAHTQSYTHAHTHTNGI